MTKQLVVDNLRYFYSELKTKNGSFYSSSSFGCIWAALYRHFIVKPFNFNIMNDSAFYQANTPYDWKKDMEGLIEYFDRSSPEKLEEDFFYNLRDNLQDFDVENGTKD